MHRLLLVYLNVQMALGLPADTNLIDVSHYGSGIFGQPSEETGRKVAGWSAETSEGNPEEMGEYLEGDILIPSKTKNGLLSSSAKWDAGIVPYVIRGPYDKSELSTIYKAMEQYHTNTCIRFRRKQPEDVDYITIQNTHTGCWSSVGKTGGAQELNLQSPGCLSTVGTPVHELMHALGFYHEQNRYERDEYVTILWDNIRPGRDGNFQKVKRDTTTGYGVKYDYGSVMHYSDYAFSSNQKPTIVPKQKGAKIGQRQGFSVGDIVKINKMYNCSAVDENSNTVEQPSYSTTPASLIESFVDMILG